MKYIPLNGNKLIKYLREDASLGIFVYDRELRIMEWCDTMKAYTGLSKEYCLRKKVLEVLPIEASSGEATAFSKALEEGFCMLSGLRFEEGILNEKSNRYDFHFFSLQEIDQQVNCVLVLVIPGKSGASKKKSSLIRSTLINIDNFLRYAPVPVFIVDTALNLKLANHAFYAFTGRSPKQSENLRSFVPASMLEQLQKHIHTVVRTAHPLSVAEYYPLAKGPRLLYNIIFPVRNLHGEIDSIGGYLIDMTRQVDQQREHAELLEETLLLNEKLHEQNQVLAQKTEALDEANRNLSEQKNELEQVVRELSDRNYELDQIMYKTSHDLRAPLTSILGLLQLAKQEKDVTKLPEYHQYIENRVHKLDDFVKAMLTFAKSSRTDISLEPIDWQQLVEGSLEQVQYLENFSRINMQISINSELYTFLSDPMRLNIILNNLIGNAIKYADTRKADPFVKVRIHNTARGASLEVEDNGIGISQEYIDKVCDMFFRATDRSEGSGLGLYIVKQTVERLSGELTIESSARVGTTIAVFLPHLEKSQGLKMRRPKAKPNKKKI